MLMLLGLIVSSGATAAEPLTVRVNDTTGVPGGPVAIVLRTYASRPIGQGQICIETQPAQPETEAPIQTATAATVFSTIPDVTSWMTADVNAQPQTVAVQFASPSMTVNASDGPLAVFFVSLSPDLVPGTQYEIVLDVQNTHFIDENGQPIQIVPRHGILTVRSPSAPFVVEANAEDASPGADALISFQTEEIFGIASGHVGFAYDPAIAVGPPVVTMDPRHGAAVFSADVDTPGTVLVDFSSPDGTLNSIPGDLIEVRIPTSPAIPVGTQSPVSLIVGATSLFDQAGKPLPIGTEGDVIDFVPPPTFRAGAVGGLGIARAPGDTLELTWTADCGFGTSHAIYRGDLTVGYASLSAEPGMCNVVGASATLPVGVGQADFFLVVPVADGLEGSYGATHNGVPRSAASAACHPHGVPDDCAP